MRQLSLERLHELLDYDPDSGLFTRRISVSNKCRKGTVAGTVSNKGYRKIQIDGYIFQAGPLAIYWLTGEYPFGLEVDHLNQDGSKDDNRFCNLRVVDRSGNQQNLKHRLGRRRGVYFHKDSGRWQAKIGRRYLGLFPTAELADEFVSLARSMCMPYSPDARDTS